jgi:hypothetical protein
VARLDRQRKLPAGFGQNTLVCGQSRQQLVRHACRRQAMSRCEPHAMLLHLIGTEQLRPQRRFIIEKLTRCVTRAWK